MKSKKQAQIRDFFYQPYHCIKNKNNKSNKYVLRQSFFKCTEKMFTYVLFTIIACLLVRYLFKKFQVWRKLPPGPIGLPIVGYIPFLGRKPYLELEKLAKKYGNIFRICLGSCNVIVLNDYESTKEAFSKDAFMGRPRDFGVDFNDVTLETKAFMGLPWKEHRRFSLHMLRDLGLGKSKIEGFIQEEIDEMLDHLKKTLGKPFKITDLLSSSMSNIISSMVFGKRLQYDDPNRHMTNSVVRKMATTASQAAWQPFFPWVKQMMIFFGIGSVSKMPKVQQVLKDYIMKEIKEHEKTFDPNNIRDYIDGYLLEIQKRKDDPSFCKSVVQDMTFFFFGAGSETGRTSVEWLLLTAAAYQDFQSRIHLEIDETVGRDQCITWENRSSMPFTEAFITELMRWKTIVPLNILRYTLADGELRGFFIPKGTYLINNLWAIHHDPDYWGKDADEFRPQRFLTDDGKAVKRWDHFMPFSIGKRACPGEPLAKVEVFMYFTSILQKFHVRLPEGRTADFEGTLGATFMSKPQDLIYTIRT